MISPGKVFGGMTLGELIAELAGARRGAWVAMMVGGIRSRPLCPRSYRGYYEDLALGADPGARPVAELLAELRAAVGADFGGYKGGVYRADADTGVWASNWGENTGIVVKSVVTTGPDGDLLILTEWVE